MTVLARSDYAGGSTAISRDMGGCGQLHEYQVGASGFPEITCGGGCEDFLRHDPNHSVMPSDVPETYDEKAEREGWEKRGALDQQYVQAIATAKMAGIEVPESLLRVARGGRQIGGTLQRNCSGGHPMADGAKFCNECGKGAQADVVRCGSGHANPVTAKFCGECAAPMGDLVQGAVVPDSPQIEAPKPARKLSLTDMKAGELRAACEAKGIDGTGTRAAMIARLRAAK